MVKGKEATVGVKKKKKRLQSNQPFAEKLLRCVSWLVVALRAGQASEDT